MVLLVVGSGGLVAKSLGVNGGVLGGQHRRVQIDFSLVADASNVHLVFPTLHVVRGHQLRLSLLVTVSDKTEANLTTNKISIIIWSKHNNFLLYLFAKSEAVSCGSRGTNVASIPQNRFPTPRPKIDFGVVVL
jgi:hypothetical protein